VTRPHNSITRTFRTPTMMLPASDRGAAHRARAQTQRLSQCGENSQTVRKRTRPTQYICRADFLHPQVSWCRKTRPSASVRRRERARCRDDREPPGTRASRRISRFCKVAVRFRNIKHFQRHAPLQFPVLRGVYQLHAAARQALPKRYACGRGRVSARSRNLASALSERN